MISIIISAIRLFTTFLFGSCGEIVTEKTGHLNLGTPGIMCVGAIGGCYGCSICISLSKNGTPNAFVCVLFAIIFAMIFAGVMGLIYSYLTVSLRANQNITGLTLTTFGVGLANSLSHKIKNMEVLTRVSPFFSNLFPVTDNSNPVLRVFFSYGILVYLSIIVAILISLFMKKTRVGLALRAVGENPGTADAAGINVKKYRYIATMIGASIAGLGGLAFVMDYANGIYGQASDIELLGWLAVALVIFSVWKPSISIAGSLLFSILYIIPYCISAPTNMKELIKMAPYLGTIIILIITSIIGKKNVQPPGSLGLNYFREER